MSFSKISFMLAAAMGAGLVAYADPPRSHTYDLPPGLAKQGKIPPGHAKKIWGKGEYLPVEYRTVYIDDWGHYDLRDAPRGYRWVRVDEDAYLVEVASGLIAEVIVDLIN